MGKQALYKPTQARYVLLFALFFALGFGHADAQQTTSQEAGQPVPMSGLGKQAEVSHPQHYLSYPRLRQADVFWEKRVWQELNICSEDNANLQILSPNLGQLLVEAVYSGNLRAFSPGKGESLFGEPWPGSRAHAGHFEATVNLAGFAQEGFNQESFAQEDFAQESDMQSGFAQLRQTNLVRPQHHLSQTTISCTQPPIQPGFCAAVNPTTVWIVEDWIMDESSFERRPRIIALGLLAASQQADVTVLSSDAPFLQGLDSLNSVAAFLEEPDQSHSKAGVPEDHSPTYTDTRATFYRYAGTPESQVLAWIPFDEARPLLVKTQALRPAKEQEGLSWDGVLLLRRFESQLMKVSNVQDLPYSATSVKQDAMWKSP